jgi:hypothetical protein
VVTNTTQIATTAFVETAVSGLGGGTVTHTAGALTSGSPVFGNGAADVKVGTARGNTTVVQLADNSTAPTTGHVATFDANGNITDGGAPAAGTVTHTSGALTADAPVFGAGTNDVKVGTKSGNTDCVVTLSGTTSANYPAVFDASGNLNADQPRGNTNVVQMASDTTNPTSGHVATFDANGNIQDGGAPGVPTTRNVSTTAPLTGGGSLSADLTLAISAFTGDTGSGGLAGAVPAPGSGDAAAGKFLKASGGWAVPGGGSGGAMVQIAKAVLASPAATITFSSIPGTYSSLLIQFLGQSSASGHAQDDCNMSANGDTAGANYIIQTLDASNTLIGANQAAARFVGVAGGAADPYPAQFTINIVGYAATAFKKTATSIAGGWGSSTSPRVDTVKWQWNNTNAITSLAFTTGSGSNFVTGTTITVYGLQ